MKKMVLALCLAIIGNMFSASNSFAEGKFIPNLNAIVGFTAGQNVPRWEYSQGIPDNDSSKFNAAHRFRIGFDYIMNENASATVLFQQGYSLWGVDFLAMGLAGNDATLDAEDYDIKVRLAYLDFTVPKTETRVRMGIQNFMTPSSATLGPPVLWSRSPGVLVNTPLTENLRATAFWMAADLDGFINDYSEPTEGIDIFGGILDFNYQKYRIAPYMLYTTMSNDAGKNYGTSCLKGTDLYPGNADTTHLGVSLSSSHFDPLILALDLGLSSSKFNDPDEEDGQGWFVLAAASYKTKYGVPKLLAWYSSGDDDGDEHLRNNFTTIRGGFNATSVLFGDDPLCPAYGYRDGVHGTMAVIAEWSQISFFNKITHTVRAMYLKGTNANENIQRIRDKIADKDDPKYATLISNISRRMNYLTTKDTVVELNFNTDYQMYKNFVVHFDLGYMNTDLEDRLPTDHNFRETYRAALQFIYSF